MLGRYPDNKEFYGNAKAMLDSA